jgi:hypothetical protein
MPSSVARTLLALVALVPACSAAGAGDDDIWDEGPLGGEVSESSQAIEGEPRFQVPFLCGQVWTGSTRTGHSPQNSIDFAIPNALGQTTVAALAGTVKTVQNLGNVSYGRWIEIDHGNGWTTRYAHLSVQSVTVGQAVAQGQKIGLVGSTGGSTGPHLHFEVRKNGSPIRNSFNGTPSFYFGKVSYTSKNCGVAPTPPAPTPKPPEPTPPNPTPPNPTPPNPTPPTPGTGFPGFVDTDGSALTVRSGAGTAFDSVGKLEDGQTVTITCQRVGDLVTGTFGTTDIWDNIGTGFVSDAFINTGSDARVAPDCP